MTIYENSSEPSLGASVASNFTLKSSSLNVIVLQFSISGNPGKSSCKIYACVEKNDLVDVPRNKGVNGLKLKKISGFYYKRRKFRNVSCNFLVRLNL